MDNMLATNADAQLILKLYELRTEEKMRTARNWVTMKFWPASSEEFLKTFQNFGSEENAHLRQVVSYWEMAAAFVLHGALDGNLFLDTNGEQIFILAKFQPFLSEIRAQFPNFLTKTELVISKSASGRQRLEETVAFLKARQSESARA